MRVDGKFSCNPQTLRIYILGLGNQTIHKHESVGHGHVWTSSLGRNIKVLFHIKISLNQGSKKKLAETHKTLEQKAEITIPVVLSTH